MNELTAKFKQELKKLGVTTVYLFGSRATGKTGPLSDHDIAILFDNRISSKKYFEIKLNLISKFSQTYKTDKIDLVILNSAPSILAMNIISQNKILLDSNKNHRIAFETYTMNRYYDRLPYEIRYAENLLKRLRALP